MNILLVAATEAEIGLSIKHIASVTKQVGKLRFQYREHEIHFLLTGAGMVATTYHLAKKFHEHTYDLAIQAGIAGSISRDISIGEVVAISDEYFADMGADDNGKFIDTFSLGLADKDAHPFEQGHLPNRSDNIPQDIKSLPGITVNTVTGSRSTALTKAEKHPNAVETMEGAAFHYVCLSGEIPFMQLRGISNYVEKRDKDSWDINLAVSNLNTYLLGYLNKLIALPKPS